MLFLEMVGRWLGMAEWPSEPARARPGSGDARAPRSAFGDAADQLTRREREVCMYVSRGLTNDEIGQRLVISGGTVSNHIEQILRKLGFSSRVQIATWTIRQGLWSAGQ